MNLNPSLGQENAILERIHMCFLLSYFFLLLESNFFQIEMFCFFVVCAYLYIFLKKHIVIIFKSVETGLKRWSGRLILNLTCSIF